MGKKYLVLDAMGVIYPFCDDVEELLIPFIKSKNVNNRVSSDVIKSLYIEASLGNISSSDFWKAVGLDVSVEDEYLSQFILSSGLIKFLNQAHNNFKGIYCLSNDVLEWSEKLRKRFDLESYISHWFISGDLRCRKPASEIYCKMLSTLKNVYPDELLFVDDNVKNLKSAEKIGIHSVLFTLNKESESREFKQVNTFENLLDLTL